VIICRCAKISTVNTKLANDQNLFAACCLEAEERSNYVVMTKNNTMNHYLPMPHCAAAAAGAASFPPNRHDILVGKKKTELMFCLTAPNYLGHG
jgi:hypothetical protein